MALVICCVFLTLRIRRRMSMSAGIGSSGSRLRPALGWKTPLNSVSACFEALRQLALDVALLGDLLEQARVAGLEEAVQLPLVAPAVGHRIRRRGSRWSPAKMITICFSTGSGSYWSCLRISVSRSPRASMAWVALSRSEANSAKAASSRYWARSRRSAAGHRLHGLDLGRAADAGDGVAHVDGGADAGVEQVGLEEDLAVGDRDDVGRDVGRDVARLGLDDGQRREAAAALLVVQPRGALEQAAVQVEDVARDRPRGPAGGAAAARSRGRPRRAWTGRRRCSRRAGRCRGSTRRSRSPRRARCRAGAPGRRRWRRPRSCAPWPRSLRAS